MACLIAEWACFYVSHWWTFFLIPYLLFHWHLQIFQPLFCIAHHYWVWWLLFGPWYFLLYSCLWQGHGESSFIKPTDGYQGECHIWCVYSILKYCFHFIWSIGQLNMKISHWWWWSSIVLSLISMVVAVIPACSAVYACTQFEFWDVKSVCHCHIIRHASKCKEHILFIVCSYDNHFRLFRVVFYPWC